MVNDGVDVILDIWDLKEGDDKYAFMEKMVTDESVTHVLAFSDSEYAAKADARNPSEEFGEALITTLERLLELKSRPPEINSWNDAWFEAHRVFVYETFLYIVAALINTGSFDTLHLILTSHYLLPETEAHGPNRFDTFGAFYGYSDMLQVLAPKGKRFAAPTAELIKRQADRTDLPFAEVMQAELLVLMMAFITDGTQWYPQTLHYSSRAGAFPFFLRATQHRNFQKLAKITGIGSADELR